jgi:hypothetical protein
VLVITGGPGVGKTTLVISILRLPRRKVLVEHYLGPRKYFEFVKDRAPSLHALRLMRSQNGRRIPDRRSGQKKIFPRRIIRLRLGVEFVTSSTIASIHIHSHRPYDCWA